MDVENKATGDSNLILCGLCTCIDKLTNEIHVPFNISNKPVLFLDDSLVMHSVKISFLFQADKGLFCLSVEDRIYLTIVTSHAKTCT